MKNRLIFALFLDIIILQKGGPLVIVRTQYLQQLQLFKEKQVIKVITGIRRCGKSTLLSQFMDCLRESGVTDGQIIQVNLEDLNNESLLDYKRLHGYITSRLSADKFNYVFLDEIQRVPDFQKAVDSLYIRPNVDIYITGSNSDLLSSELATLLTGRYVEIKMLPFSFAEYVQAYPDDFDKKALFAKFMQQGAMPYVTNLPDDKAVNTYLEGIYNTILNNDISHRYPQADMSVLESILRYLAHNVGNLVSSTNIANTLTSNRRKTSYNTVEKYIRYLQEAFLVYESSRYDVKGKQHLKSLAKYYIVDLGLRNLMLANRASDLGHVLENVVYLELLRRGYKVNVGKLDNREVDFVATNAYGIEYYQVAATVLDADKRNAELEPLLRIKDNYSKTLITLDDYGLGNYDGIKIVNAISFLLDK